MRKLSSLLALCLVLSLSTARADEDAARSRANFQEAIKHYNVGEYKEALELFKAAYFFKADPALLFNIAQCHRQLGDFANAVRQYRTFLREYPKAPNRGEVERFIKMAEEELQRRGATPPQSPQGEPPVAGPTKAPEKPPDKAVEEKAPDPKPPEHPPVVSAPQPPPAAPAPAAPKRPKWIWGVIGAAAAVVVAGVAVGIAYGVPNDAAVPSSSLGSASVHF